MTITLTGVDGGDFGHRNEYAAPWRNFDDQSGETRRVVTDTKNDDGITDLAHRIAVGRTRPGRPSEPGNAAGVRRHGDQATVGLVDVNASGNASGGGAGVMSDGSAPPSGLSRPPAPDVVRLGVAVVFISLSGPMIAATAAPVLAIAFWRCLIGSGITGLWVGFR